MKNLKKEKLKGFTLVELSIVLIIIGIIIAGIIGGQSLIQQAKLKKIITETNSFKVAFNTFNLEYSSIPGDMKNASSYWPGCNVSATDAACNGNGNKKIEWHSDSEKNETYQAWQHLSLAGLLHKTFRGTCCLQGGTDTDTAFAGETEMYFSDSGFGKYMLYYTWFVSTPDNHFALLGSRTENIWKPAISVKNAFAIDTKIDDGMAHHGTVLAKTGNRHVPSDGCSASGSDYNKANLNNDTLSCLMAFLLQ